jgi:hypothetical protein
LQILEDFFVEVVEQMPFGAVVEVDLVDLVDDLAQQLAGLHVVEGVLEHLRTTKPRGLRWGSALRPLSEETG